MPTSSFPTEVTENSRSLPTSYLQKWLPSESALHEAPRVVISKRDCAADQGLAHAINATTTERSVKEVRRAVFMEPNEMRVAKFSE